MAPARALAGLAAGGELAAGRGAPLVDAASGPRADAARQRRAARLGMVGAAHAGRVIGYLHRQAIRHVAAASLRFSGVGTADGTGTSDRASAA